jgi:non-ribosomal peptide synthase protein (TIGR01720 family)
MSNTDLRARIERLSPQQRVMLTQRLKQGAPSSNGRSPAQSSKQLAAYVVASPNMLAGELRDFLSARLPNYTVPAHIIVLDALPLTPNGKVDRNALPDPTDHRQASTGAVATPKNEIEEKLTAIWSAVLGMDPIAVNDNFFEIGGDSILSIQVVAKARQAGLKLAPTQLFQHQTIAELAAVIGNESVAPMAQPVQSTSDIPLTPIQHWFFEQQFAEPHHWNQALLVETPGLDLKHLQRAAQALAQHHDALRLTFAKHAGQVQQRVQGEVAHVGIERIDLRDMPSRDVASAIQHHAAALQASLNPEAGPLMRLGYFDLGQGRASRLLIVIHHLAVDGASWQTILEDLEAAYLQSQRSQPIQFPPATTAFGLWAQRISTHAQSAPVQRELNFWRKHLATDAPDLPLDSEGVNDEASTREIVVELSERETNALLRELPAMHDIRINEALAAAVMRALSEWTESDAQLIGVEGHGREGIAEGLDLSRSVGWFTSFYPAALTWRKRAPVLSAAQEVARQLRQISTRGLSYGALRYLSQDTAVRQELAALPQSQVLLNYLGQFSQMLSGLALFKLAQESPGAVHSPRARRHHLIEINAAVVSGRLRSTWQYSANLHRPETIQTLADAFADTLRMLTVHAPAANDASKFAQSGLNEAELDDLLAELDESR